MNFITEKDYNAIIRTEIKEILTEKQGIEKIKTAENMAMAQIKNYLAGIYDIDNIFNKTDNNRNSHIVMIVIDCALYHLYTSVAPDQIPKIRSERYGDAMEWLKGVSNGEVRANLPLISNNENSLMKLSSKYKSSKHKW